MSLHQFVISHPNPDFEAVRESIRVYQDVIEVDSISNSFKNVSFADETCNLCGKDHQSLCCPSLKSVIEMETSSKKTYRPRNWSYSPDDRNNVRQSDNRSTVAIGIEDLVVLSVEATIIGMAGPAIDAISNMVAGAEVHPLGIMVIGIISVVIHIIAEVPHLVDMLKDRATNVSIIIINGRQSWGQNRDQTRQQYGYDNNYFTHTERNDSVNDSDPRGQSCKGSRTVRFEKFCYK